MTPLEYIQAARVPDGFPVGEFGPWRVECLNEPMSELAWHIFPRYVLTQYTEETRHLERGAIVMEDSNRELGRHVPIWTHAEGRVLVTGLGLGCVVRGLLHNPKVTSIVVVEMCPHIVELAWREFVNDPRCQLVVGDATKYVPESEFDYAWHDIWAGDSSVAPIHSKMIVRFVPWVRTQGAWGMPRWWRNKVGGPFVYRENTRIWKESQRDRADICR